jgi:hypothetical protein
MSLMQLLAMGRSIGTIQDRPTPYKMRQQNLVPKFRSTAWPTVKRMDLPRLRAAEGEAAPTALSERGHEDATTKPAPVVVEKGPRLAYPQGRWSSMSKPFAWRKPGSAPLQGELGLDGVRVIRNDLQDSDLELVSSKAQWNAAVEVARERIHDLEPLQRLRTWWGRMTGAR